MACWNFILCPFPAEATTVRTTSCSLPAGLRSRAPGQRGEQHLPVDPGPGGMLLLPRSPRGPCTCPLGTRHSNLLQEVGRWPELAVAQLPGGRALVLSALFARTPLSILSMS